MTTETELIKQMRILKVVIMRGLPGSGKTTYIKEFSNRYQVNVCSADFYHMIGGQYRFDPAKAGEAHARCLKNYLDLLASRGRIFVDNTNTMAWEIAPYYALALAYGADVEIVRLHCSLETACARNIHNVPVSTLVKMERGLLTECLPPHWTERIILGGCG